MSEVTAYCGREERQIGDKIDAYYLDLYETLNNQSPEIMYIYLLSTDLNIDEI